MSSQQESPLHSSFAQHLYAFREYAYTDILGPKDHAHAPCHQCLQRPNLPLGVVSYGLLQQLFNCHATVLISTRNIWDLLAVQGFVLPGCFL